MRPRIFVLLAALATTLLGAASVSATDREGLKVIVNAELETPPRDVEAVAAIYRGAPPVWPDGRDAWPLHAAQASPIYDAFARQVLGRRPDTVDRFRQRQVFAGVRGAPITSDVDAIVQYVAERIDAIGYVPCETPLPPEVAVAVTTGCGAFDVAEDPYGASPVDSTIGDVALTHIGGCGVEGRRVIVQHRGRFGAIQVSVEVTSWIQEQMQRRSTDVYVLSPGEERDLGCTRPSDSSRRVVVLADVSDASVGGADVAGWRAPVNVARDAVDVDLAGSCGRGGRAILVSNRERHRALRVELEIETRVDGRMRRRFTKSLRLDPGGRAEVGCSADGALRTHVQVARASFE